MEGHEEINNARPLDVMAKREQLSSVSTALTLAIGIGLFEAVALWLGSGVFLSLMGLSSVSFSHPKVAIVPKISVYSSRLCACIISVTCTYVCILRILVPSNRGWVSHYCNMQV